MPLAATLVTMPQNRSEVASTRNTSTTSSVDDEATIAEIEANLPHLRRYARYLMRASEGADDLVQEALLRAINNIHSYTPGTNMRAWLFRILRNLHIDQIRSRKNETPFDADMIEPAAAGNQIDTLQLQDLKAAVDTLPDSQREVILLIGVEGLSYEEAARIVKVPVGTVRSRLSRARSKLLEILTHGEDGPAGGQNGRSE